MASAYSTLTTRMGEWLEDTGDTQWPVEFKRRRLLDAAIDFARRTRCGRLEFQPTEFALSDPAHAFYEMYVNPAAYQLGACQWFEVNRIEYQGEPMPFLRPESLGTRWEETTGDRPLGFILGDWGLTNVVIGSSAALMRAWPAPPADLSADIKVYGTVVPLDNGTTPNADDQFPVIPYEWEEACVRRAVADCWRRNGEQNDYQKAADHMDYYESQVALALPQMIRGLKSQGFVLPYRNV